MYYMVNTWSPRPEWSVLRLAERRAAVGDLLTIIRPIRRRGVTLVSAGRLSSYVLEDCRGYSYAIWEAAAAELLEELGQTIESSLWHRLVHYTTFDGTNIELEDLLVQQADFGA